jgi:hypothetical protein
MTEIPNELLTLDQIPQPGASWHEIGGFGLTFNGYEFHGSFEACGEVADHWLKSYRQHGTLPDSLNDLRTCLFFEQRRWRHFGSEPDEEAMTYIRALVNGIWEMVKKQKVISSK